MLSDFAIDELASVCIQRREGVFLIGSHEPAVPRLIRGKNGGQPAFDAFRGQSGAPQTAWAE